MLIKLSPSKIQTYETCPRMYYFKYIANVPVETTSANLPFGSAIHTGIEQHLLVGADPVDVFEAEWKKANETQAIQFSSQWSQSEMNDTGVRLMQLFPEQWNDWGYQIAYEADDKPLIERMFSTQLNHNDLDVLFRGKIDIGVFTPDGHMGVLDWKAPAQASTVLFAERADQHTAYQMLIERETELDMYVDKVGYAELVKVKMPKKNGRGPYIPKIHWVDRRSDEMIEEYKLKILKTAQDIQRNYFPRQPGMAFNTPCNMCDYPDACMKCEN